MNLHERVLSVLQCRYVNEVVIGAPWQVSRDMIETMNIKIMARGTCSDYPSHAADPYKIAHELGIFKQFKSTYADLTTSTIIQRIIANRLKYIERNKKKAGKDSAASSLPSSLPINQHQRQHQY